MVGLVDRERELARLDELWRRPGPALIAIYGRRRVGKTYFLQRVLADRRGVYFLAAESSALENLEELLDQIRRAFPERRDATLENYPSWRTALRLLTELAADEPVLVVLDEFSYLVHVEPAIPSLIQAVWDGDAVRTHLKLVLCGSEVGLLAALDEYGQPLHGRFDWIQQYTPLDYYDASRFLHAAAGPDHGYSTLDLLRCYGLFGGSGRYLVAIDPRRPLGENVAKLLLDPHGIFHREGQNLIRQERGIRDYASYNAVLEAIARGATEWGEIANQSHVERATMAACLQKLQELGWIVHERPFEEPERRGIYRLADNFLKSWYRFVFQHRSALQMAPAEETWRTLVQPDLDQYMGQLVFEDICTQHLKRFRARYGLPMVLDVGRWWSRRNDVELDLVARGADERYLFGECKWSRRPLDVAALVDLQRKVAATPHGRWRNDPRYALFAVGGFTPRLVDLARELGVLLIGPDELFPPSETINTA